MTRQFWHKIYDMDSRNPPVEVRFELTPFDIWRVIFGRNAVNEIEMCTSNEQLQAFALTILRETGYTE